MRDLSTPFNIPAHKTDELVTEMGKMPFGSLIGNILSACVDAQNDAAEAAWKYTQEVLKEKDPIVFTFQEGETMKKLSVPLITIVPLPYLRLDNIDIDFDAEVNVNTERSKQFLVTVNTQETKTEGESFNVVKGNANMHIGINAGTTDMPAGLAMLMQMMGDGLVVKDVYEVPARDELGQLAGSLVNHVDNAVSGIVRSLEPYAPETPRTKPQPPSSQPPTSRPATSWTGLPSSGSGQTSQRSSGSSYSDFNGLMYSLRANGAYFTGGEVIDNPAKYNGGPLTGIHVNWTKPSYSQQQGVTTPYQLSDCDLLSTILSALLWRKANGPIKLYTDNRGLAYYNSMEMTNLWNGGIDIERLNNIPDTIPADIFWAAGKIYAAKTEKTPFAMLDTDLMVWQSIRNSIGPRAIVAFHPETLQGYNSCYLPYEQLKKPPKYRPDPDWDWNQNPVNTALTYYGNSADGRAFRNDYTNAAITFMTGNTERPKEMVSQMVFAEQRIYAMCAKKRFGAVPTFMAREGDPDEPFTHIWGNKAVARDNAAANFELCSEMARLITRMFADVPLSPQVMTIINKYRNVTNR